MDNMIFYFIIIVLIAICDIPIIYVSVVIIIFAKHLFNTKKKCNSVPKNIKKCNIKSESVNTVIPLHHRNNEKTLDNILTPDVFTADDKLADMSMHSGRKNKKATEIRSHWNNNNWKKYYDYELGIHENREWWTDNDHELSKKHVLI
jgi:hypothetical protein